MSALRADYEERVYAGVLGKIIAVYLGRPFEGWPHERIKAELGEITWYVNHRDGVALKNRELVVTDDDISGTFVFPRVLRDHSLDPAPEDVGATWLDYIVEDRTVLWWGGLGNSTEHTAYLRLLAGERPPRSGSAARNGTVVAEQVGAEIFVEGLAMTCPGDPELAADLASGAASVSHDGEALHGARVVAALVAAAFIETDMDRLLDTAAAQIPKDSGVYRVIDDVRAWAASDADWRDTRRRIADRYGYDRYGGNCHVIPNHALVICALAHSGGEFARAMTVINTAGWDTDSNAGNVGAIAGVRGGLAGIDAGSTCGRDWRGPVADRMYLPSADGGATITDAAREALTLAALGRARHGEEPVVPKGGARFHFALAGSVQGFRPDDPAAPVVNTGGELEIPYGDRVATVTTPTFIPPDAEADPIYGLQACPTLYPGQRLRAAVRAPVGSGPIACRLVVRAYSANDRLDTYGSDAVELPPGGGAELAWTVPATGNQPIAAVGVEVVSNGRPGVAYLDHLTWDGTPDVTLTRPATNNDADAMANGARPSSRAGAMWRRAWVDATDRFDARWPEPFRLVQNRGTGLLIQGTRDWRDYAVDADVTPHLADAVGLAARVHGLRRYYAVELVDRDVVRLVRMAGECTVLAAAPFAWSFGETYRLRLEVDGDRISAAVDDLEISSIDPAGRLDCGSVALLITQGRTATTAVRVHPINPAREGATQ